MAFSGTVYSYKSQSMDIKQWVCLTLSLQRAAVQAIGFQSFSEVWVKDDTVIDTVSQDDAQRMKRKRYV